VDRIINAIIPVVHLEIFQEASWKHPCLAKALLFIIRGGNHYPIASAEELNLLQNEVMEA
jgi:hypothetical protein